MQKHHAGIRKYMDLSLSALFLTCTEAWNMTPFSLTEQSSSRSLKSLYKRFMADLDVVVQQISDCSVQCVCYSYERWQAHFGFTAFDVTYIGKETVL